jgi:CubicO group peptidase (beta-lactamase class C family)
MRKTPANPSLLQTAQIVTGDWRMGMKVGTLAVLLAWAGLQADLAIAQPALTQADAEAYVDGLVPYALRRADMAGAVVVVVKDGQVLFQKGYGVADVKTGQPVDPNTTMFRPASISKLFTWTAVMQLVEQGRLDLDRDVNSYLDFRIPPAFGKPITLRNLLTHTAGFEDTYKNGLLEDPKVTPTIETYVKTALPPRIFAPGTTVAYSNYGATLAGYIVQRVSGEKFEAYVTEHIFVPLGMDHSTFLQPVPTALGVAAPKGYVTASMPAVPFEFLGTVPAGALSSTGADMARFMIAHLNDGRVGSAQILREDTAQHMHAPAYRPVAGLPAMSLGFYGEDRNNHRIIGHAGDLISFHADLHLLLDDHVGLFIAMNSLGNDVASSALRTALFQGFVDRYFPAPLPEEPTLATATAHGKLIAGQYVISRRAQSSFASLGNLLGQGTLHLDADGTVTMSTLKGINGEPRHWHEVAPFLWREVRGTARMAAVLDGGRVQFLFSDDTPPILEWQPVPAAERASWNLPLLGVTVVILALTVLLWPVAALIRRYYGRPLLLRGQAQALYRLVRVVALLDLIFLSGWLIFLLLGSKHLALLSDASDPMLRLIQLVGVVGLIGLIPVLVYLVSIWRNHSRGVWSKLSNSTIAFACLATAWFTFGYHLLRLSLNY